MVIFKAYLFLKGHKKNSSMENKIKSKQEKFDRDLIKAGLKMESKQQKFEMKQKKLEEKLEKTIAAKEEATASEEKSS